MGTKVLEVHPKELQFIFEVKKQSTCTVQLINKTNYDVAFKVKTTSPKKYCVRPNVGVVPPKSMCDFTVTMQAQKVAPPDFVCKDKFLIQGTIVPAGTTEQDITTSVFAKDDGKLVEEIKLRVALLSPPHSPVLSPIDGVLKQGPILQDLMLQDPESRKFSRERNSGPLDDQKSNEVKDMDLKPDKEIGGQRWEFFNDPKLDSLKNMELKPEKDVGSQHIQPSRDLESASAENVVTGHEAVMKKSVELSPVQEQTSNQEFAASIGAEDATDRDGISSTLPSATRDGNFTPVKSEISRWDSQQENVRDSSPSKVFRGKELEARKKDDLKPEHNTVHNETLKPAEEAPLAPSKDVASMKVKAVEELALARDIEEMKEKLNGLESKLHEAGVTISKLTEERRLSSQERNMLQEELALLRRSTNMRKVHAGFPLLFVVMVALISTLLGYLSHSSR